MPYNKIKNITYLCRSGGFSVALTNYIGNVSAINLNI